MKSVRFEKEIDKLNNDLEIFKKTIEESNILYESMLDKTTKSMLDIINSNITSVQFIDDV